MGGTIQCEKGEMLDARRKMQIKSLEPKETNLGVTEDSFDP